MRDTAITPLTIHSLPLTNDWENASRVANRGLASSAGELRPFFKDFDVSNGMIEVQDAFAAYEEAGVAPNYEELREARRIAEQLKDALLTAEHEQLGRRDLAVANDIAFSAARERAPSVDVSQKAAPQILLAHLETVMNQFLKSSPEVATDRFPDVYVALQNYFDLLDHKTQMPPYPDREAVHESVRDKLSASRHQAIIREFARAAVEDRKNNNNLYAILGITKDYRSTPEDQEAFRALFLSGKIIRSKMVYASPEECAELYALYERQIDNAVRHSSLSNACRTDMIGVRTYTVSSNELNQALREGNIEKIREFAPYIKVAISGLNQLRAYSTSLRSSRDVAPKPEWVFRGVRLSVEELLKKGYVKGNAIDVKSFMSCSHSRSTGYCRLTDKYNVQMKIKARTPKLLGDLSLHNQSEDEVLFPPEKRFRIIDVKFSKGLEKNYPHVDIVMEEIDEDQIDAFPEQSQGKKAVQNASLRKLLDPYFIAFRKKDQAPPEVSEGS